MSRQKSKDARFDVRVSRGWLEQFDDWLHDHYPGKTRSEWIIQMIDKIMAGHSVTDYDMPPETIQKLKVFAESRRPPANPSDVIVAAIKEYIDNS